MWAVFAVVTCGNQFVDSAVALSSAVVTFTEETTLLVGKEATAEPHYPGFGDRRLILGFAAARLLPGPVWCDLSVGHLARPKRSARIRFR